MSSTVLRRWIRVSAILMILAVPVAARAQEATVSGTVTDSTGGVLPGVTIKAVNDASGNSFEAVTDARGAYRLAVRIGGYQITATLVGFGTVSRRLELLVGQASVLNLQLAPSTVQESVTVTGEAPLIATTTSSVSGNIDPKQMSELPVLGRNWMSLSLLAPGNRTNTQGSVPVQDRHAGDVREFELNVDGQQVTAVLGTGNQARYSKDSIAEFQFISNRFDATQGRSSGVQVNAITKSGTNRPSGSFLGSFRDSKFNNADPVLHVVVPYSDQQWSATFGGPIRKDKVHFFGNVDYEHQPITSIWNTPYPAFNISRSGVTSIKMAGVRLDYELSSKTHLMTKVSGSNLFQPFGAGNNNHPGGTATNGEYSREVLAQLTKVIGNRAVNEIKGGLSSYRLDQAGVATWSHHWQAPDITAGGPRILMRGFSVSQNQNLPRHRIQKVWSLRDDFSTSYQAAGAHALKVGGEFLYHDEFTRNCLWCMGELTANSAAIPAPAVLQSIFPDPFNVDSWNLNALSSITTRYKVGVSTGKFNTPYSIPKYGAWAQDDWTLTRRLTLNLGVRWDLAWNGFAQEVTLAPWMAPNRPQDWNNVQPRLGFAYSLNDRTVLRGGGGRYFADVTSPNVQWAESAATIALITANNDGRADFASNPFNGPLPTFDQAQKLYCYVNNNAPGCLIRDLMELAPPPGKLANVGNSWQSSIGMQRQFGSDMALDADYVFTGSRNEHRIQDNVNIKFDPATGLPLNFNVRDASGRFINRPFPDWGVVGLYLMNGRSNYNGLQTVFTKRMSHRWQGTLTYTLSTIKDSDPTPLSYLTEVPFAVNPAFGNDYGPAVSDQRHRAVFNGIWDAGYGFQLSGIYFYGSGETFAVTSGAGVSTTLIGAAGTDRLRTDGTIVPRNAFVGSPIKRVDVRLSRHFKIGSRMGADGTLELFNALNRANYGGYVTNESSSQYKQPSSSTNLSYTPRSLQLGFRLTF
jgi:Carboxypeptidase regulatory-like domain/TonB dependent receptor